MPIDYDHQKNTHTLAGPRAALSVVFIERKPKSLLDVGCGAGTWLKAAQDLGVPSIFGIDGIQVSELLFPRENFQQLDLTQPIDLGKQFEAVLCLEVAEHLEPTHAENLIGSLTRHADWILFSAACPGQPGQHHVNCQWPSYWQSLFNKHSFACEDSIRWKIWNSPEIEPWYRQNIFVAQRNPSLAGKENRIHSVVHPDIVSLMNAEASRLWEEEITKGALPPQWYASAAGSALVAKIRRKLGA